MGEELFLVADVLSVWRVASPTAPRTVVEDAGAVGLLQCSAFWFFVFFLVGQGRFDEGFTMC